MPFILGASEKPLTKESFANMFADACRAAGVKTSARELRKIAAQWAADAGATVSEMKAVFGWGCGRMALQYTQTADRRRFAIKGGKPVVTFKACDRDRAPVAETLKKITRF